MNHHNFSKLIIATITICSSLFSCSSNAQIEKSGQLVSCDLKGQEETKYVMCVNKKSPQKDKVLQAINEVIHELDINEITSKYCDYKNRRKNHLLEDYRFNLNDNKSGVLSVMASTFEPFNYSGAGGCYSDGIDTYLLHHVAEKLDFTYSSYDYEYNTAYQKALERRDVDVFVSGIAKTEQTQDDFLLSDVYLTSHQQIISDKNESYSSLEDLKGKKIGVVSGREGMRIVSKAINEGPLKDSGANLIECASDAEVESLLLREMCDVVLLDELPAKLIVEKANA